MSDAMRAHFAEILHKWKNELMEEVDRTVHHMQDDARFYPRRVDDRHIVVHQVPALGPA